MLLIIVFVIGYVLIALEHPVRLDKAATALLTGTLCWIILGHNSAELHPTGGHATDIHHALFEHLGEISEILFFLLGAMTIVELMDAHDGFSIITDRIRTNRRLVLLWLISWVAFFMSAVLDNMTTAIIMCALLRRILQDEQDIWKMGGFVIIAANAGGAWSPIGDVTTIMLWIGGQVTSTGIIKTIFPESVVCLLMPLLAASFFMKGQVSVRHRQGDSQEEKLPTRERNLVFFIGAGSLLAVPVFKQLTHFPPYLGVLLALGIVWYATEWMHRRKEDSLREDLSVAATLRRIDTPSILFFLGILLAVAALDTSGHLKSAATLLSQQVNGNIYLLNTLVGLLSAVVDNVPLVAASMAMYDLATYPTDHLFWQLLAYCAGTGGSLLIIGSAAGVAAMGILKINFLWYLRHIGPYALLGYVSGIAYYIFSA
jgi:Na+/H+ antiporter NhaD/arsenite permease-like protein